MEELVVGIQKIDSRIYLAKSSYCGGQIWEQWEEEMRGAESIWDKAVCHTREYGEKNGLMQVHNTSECGYIGK